MNNPIDYWYQKYLKEKQTKKDLALTWEDVRVICEMEMDLWEEVCQGNIEDSTQPYYEEVLKRFNEYKSKKNESK